jgi:hypothetical protein
VSAEFGGLKGFGGEGAGGLGFVPKGQLVAELGFHLGGRRIYNHRLIHLICKTLAAAELGLSRKLVSEWFAGQEDAYSGCRAYDSSFSEEEA